MPKVTAPEWQTDALAAASATNFVIEGDDATTDAITATTRLFNYTCISDKVALVSGTTEAVKAAGRRSEMAYQMVNSMKALKRDVDKILMENNAYVAGNATTARETAGLQAYIKTNINKASDGTAATGDGSDGYTDGTARALLESYAEAVLALTWAEGGNPTTAYCGSFQKRKMAAWSGSSTKTQDGAKMRVVNSVDVYVDPLGSEIKVVPSRQVPTDVIYFIDPDHVKFAVLRDFQTHELAKTGDSVRKQILVEFGLIMGNEKAHGGVYDLTTS